MHLHMLMFCHMVFHNWEWILQNLVVSSFFGEKIGTTDFHAIKNEFQCRFRLTIDGKFIYIIGQVNNTF